MKKSILTLVIVAFVSMLSACSSEPKYYDLLSADVKYELTDTIVEVCLPKPLNEKQYPKTVLGSAIRTTSYSVHYTDLVGTTVDGEYIYRGFLTTPNKMNYYLLQFKESDGNEFVFKRDFTKYEMNSFSSWEKPDYVFDIKEANTIATKYKETNTIFNNDQFAYLATHQKDKTTEIKHIGYDIKKIPKVRFALMDFNEYKKTMQPKDQLTIAKNLPSCS